MLYSFFYAHGPPRDLHSFPTRRSSDLADASLIELPADAVRPDLVQLVEGHQRLAVEIGGDPRGIQQPGQHAAVVDLEDRKSTRLNSSHGYISYAVFCLKKKKKRRPTPR